MESASRLNAIAASARLTLTRCQSLCTYLAATGAEPAAVSDAESLTDAADAVYAHAHTLAQLADGSLDTVQPDSATVRGPGARSVPMRDDASPEAAVGHNREGDALPSADESKQP